GHNALLAELQDDLRGDLRRYARRCPYGPARVASHLPIVGDTSDAAVVTGRIARRVPDDAGHPPWRQLPDEAVPPSWRLLQDEAVPLWRRMLDESAPPRRH
ncbi:hypothetical protein HK405_015063, partial [Cladochytrium tenue]